MDAQRPATPERILFALLCTVALVPLVVVKGLAFPFIVPRELVFRTVLLAALPFVALGIPGTGRPRPGPLGWTVLAMVAAAGLSVLSSIDPGMSLWGSPERLSGFLTIALVALFGASLTEAFMKRPSRRTTFLRVWFSAWAVVAALAIVERFWIGPWAQFHTPGGRVISTVGNPIFLGNGLLLALWTAAATLLARGRSGKNTALLAAFTVLFGVAILFTETRGAYLGAAAGVVTAGITFAIWSRHRAARILGVALPITMLLLVGALLLVRDMPFVTAQPVLARVVSTFSPTDASRTQRFALWEMAARGIMARPLLGWGLENADAAFDRNYLPGFTKYLIANSFSDRAHDIFLDVGLTAGFLGLAAYVGFLAAIAWRIIGLKRKGTLPAPAAAVAIGGLAAYVVSGLTSFDTLVTLLGLAVASALLSSLERSGRTAELARAPSVTPGIIGGAFAVILFFVGVVSLGIGARTVHLAITARDGGQMADAAARAEGSAWNPYGAFVRQRVGNEIFKAVGNKEERGAPAATLLPLADALLRTAVAGRPTAFSARFTLGNVVLLEAVNGIRTFDDARAALEAARPLAPKRQMTDYQIGNSYLAEHRAEDAVASFRQALALDPSVPESHWHLGRALAVAGHGPEAAGEFRAAWNGHFGDNRPPQEYAVAINTLLDAGDLSMVRSVYEKWSETDPENPSVFGSLARVEAELGHTDAAIAALRRTVELDPTVLSEVPGFLKLYGYPPDALDGIQP